MEKETAKEMAENIRVAAAALKEARALVVTAGAGMGVDSGLPDFRGTEGFWRAYPAFQKLNLRFEELANPYWFDRDPARAWGFYGHRLMLYRATTPHRGFEILRNWGERMPEGAFVFTSNVDGQFQKAGFGVDRIVECHGSIHHLQCLRNCGIGIFPANSFSIEIDEETMRAKEPFPRCPSCGALSRPNILMFGDWGWDSDRTEEEERRLSSWLALSRGPVAVVECGAGTALPAVRSFGEQFLMRKDAVLIRINVREAQGPVGRSPSRSGGSPRFIGLPLGAKEALELIDSE